MFMPSLDNDSKKGGGLRQAYFPDSQNDLYCSCGAL